MCQNPTLSVKGPTMQSKLISGLSPSLFFGLDMSRGLDDAVSALAENQSKEPR